MSVNHTPRYPFTSHEDRANAAAETLEALKQHIATELRLITTHPGCDLRVVDQANRLLRDLGRFYVGGTHGVPEE